jgi:hypothetical protein
MISAAAPAAESPSSGMLEMQYTKYDLKVLKAHSNARTPVAKISKLMKRTEGSLRQKARTLGIGLGYQR